MILNRKTIWLLITSVVALGVIGLILSGASVRKLAFNASVDPALRAVVFNPAIVEDSHGEPVTDEYGHPWIVDIHVLYSNTADYPCPTGTIPLVDMPFHKKQYAGWIARVGPSSIAEFGIHRNKEMGNPNGVFAYDKFYRTDTRTNGIFAVLDSARKKILKPPPNGYFENTPRGIPDKFSDFHYGTSTIVRRLDDGDFVTPTPIEEFIICDFRVLAVAIRAETNR